jgi:hypothetical protein
VILKISYGTSHASALTWGRMSFAPPQETVQMPPVPEQVLPTPNEETPELDEVALAEKKALALQEAEASVEEAAHTFLEESSSEAIPVDPLVQEIESMLAVDLDGAFKELPEAVKTRFLADGRMLAHRVFDARTHLEPNDVVKWIRAWLHQIPRVNKAFLAQDAKIKTDLLLARLREEQASPA